MCVQETRLMIREEMAEWKLQSPGSHARTHGGKLPGRADSNGHILGTNFPWM